VIFHVHSHRLAFGLYRRVGDVVLNYVYKHVMKSVKLFKEEK